MDRITSSYLQAFKQAQSFSDDLQESVLFEHFVNYCIVSKEYNAQFSLEDVHVGGGGDLGMDGIAIIVNGNLITSPEELDDFAKSNKYLDVEFIFIQSKTSNSFDAKEIGTFLGGVEFFFGSVSELPPVNDQIKYNQEIMESIYNKSPLFKNKNPLLKLYYVTTGKWENDQYITSVANRHKRNLESLKLFQEVNIHFFGSDEIQSLYQFINNKISKEIVFPKKIALPEVSGVQEAYIGILPALEYLKLITDDYNNIVKGLFYDNVRDYQGENDVNKEIKDTILSGSQESFVLYNNGITIVAEEMKPVGDKISLFDYQIVNGCQTSYVLYENKNRIGETLYVPIKIICLNRDSEIKNNIIKANNRQTPVKIEELIAITAYQKKLEEYYKSFPDKHKLYYERRDKQYNGDNEVLKIKIVDIRLQIRCFASMFLEQAHNSGRYYAKLMEESNTKLFLPDHDPIGYYISAYANFRLNEFFRNKQIDGKYRPFRYHILNIFRVQTSGISRPRFSSKDFKKYCEKMEEILFDDTKCKDSFIKATDIIDNLVVEGDYSRSISKTASFAKKVKSMLA
jgi:hypothetical protein